MLVNQLFSLFSTILDCIKKYQTHSCKKAAAWADLAWTAVFIVVHIIKYCPGRKSPGSMRWDVYRDSTMAAG
jgi:hypothetical protein